MFLLSGILIIVAGFVIGLNPLLVVTVAGFVTGLIGPMDVVKIVSALGKSFVDSRSIAIIYLVIPVVGLLERSGLRERAQQLVSRVKAATTGRILLFSLVVRQITAALGPATLGGHAQMVRPPLAPITEGRRLQDSAGWAAALPELPDRNGVIKVRIPTGIPLLIASTLLMYFTVFRF